MDLKWMLFREGQGGKWAKRPLGFGVTSPQKAGVDMGSKAGSPELSTGSSGSIFRAVSLSPNVPLPPCSRQHASPCSFYCHLMSSRPARSLVRPQLVHP